ncbi:MAG TPA: hypothetical protein VG826_19230 [Pirellulales bacterium]|nr:hypothetical protein [Pirellulales bacterium]
MKSKKLSRALCVLLLVAGCGGPPQVTPVNRRLIEGLRTATSSEQMQWVDESAKQLEEGKRNGTVSDQEYEIFQSIIAMAKEGKWKEANAEAVRLGKAQKPTAEEVERLKAKRKDAG